MQDCIGCLWKRHVPHQSVGSKDLRWSLDGNCIKDNRLQYVWLKIRYVAKWCTKSVSWIAVTFPLPLYESLAALLLLILDDLDVVGGYTLENAYTIFEHLHNLVSDVALHYDFVFSSSVLRDGGTSSEL